ncbi:MAG: hypothetical protein FWC41_04155 [Firmicutes bacterium]|nr:hypothetical protein [Bacillota bacterium]
MISTLIATICAPQASALYDIKELEDQANLEIKNYEKDLVAEINKELDLYGDKLVEATTKEIKRYAEELTAQLQKNLENLLAEIKKERKAFSEDFERLEIKSQEKLKTLIF